MLRVDITFQVHIIALLLDIESMVSGYMAPRLATNLCNCIGKKTKQGCTCTPSPAAAAGPAAVIVDTY